MSVPMELREHLARWLSQRLEPLHLRDKDWELADTVLRGLARYKLPLSVLSWVSANPEAALALAEGQGRFVPYLNEDEKAKLKALTDSLEPEGVKWARASPFAASGLAEGTMVAVPLVPIEEGWHIDPAETIAIRLRDDLKDAGDDTDKRYDAVEAGRDRIRAYGLAKIAAALAASTPAPSDKAQGETT